MGQFCSFPELYHCCNSLTSLELNSVNVTGDVLHNFLNNCPSLELLSVEGSETLIELDVPCTQVNLRYLKITYCFEVKDIKIYATNLISFEYFGPKISGLFVSAKPMFVDISIGGTYCDYLTNNLEEVESHLSQVETINLACRDLLRDCMQSTRFPLCSRIKQLELKLNWWLCVPDPLEREEILKGEACPHYHLKMVEIVGFLGHAIDLEFAMYLMENTVSLEKIIIDPCEPSRWDLEIGERQLTPRKLAKQLYEKLKPGMVTYCDVTMKSQELRCWNRRSEELGLGTDLVLYQGYKSFSLLYVTMKNLSVLYVQTSLIQIYLIREQ